MSFRDFWVNLLADPWWNGFLVAFVLFLLLELGIVGTKRFLRGLERTQPQQDGFGAPLRPSYGDLEAGPPTVTPPRPQPAAAGDSEPAEVPRFGVPELVQDYDPADYIEPLCCTVDERELSLGEWFWKIPPPAAGPEDPFLVICHSHTVQPSPAEVG
jgi:hypothetical protein